MQQEEGSQQKPAILEKCQLGPITLKNRIIVPSLNRLRANPKDCSPTLFMGLYFQQKHQYGLVITDNNLVSDDYNPIEGLPGLFSDSHVAPWKEIVGRVHYKHGAIVASLFHPGRVVSDAQLPSGRSAKAASAIQVQGLNKFANSQPFAVPQSVSVNEIQQLIASFKQAAKRAHVADFDGVQIEAGNGYLIDTFLRDQTNQRTDTYGGSIPNRCRLLLEIVDAVSEINGSQWVSVKLSPKSTQYDMKDSNPYELMEYLLPELSKRNLAFVEIRKGGYLDVHPTNPIPLKFPVMDMSAPLQDEETDFFPKLRNLYKGNLIANYDFPTINDASDLIQQQNYQACSLDVLSVGNPDLPQRVVDNAKLNYNIKTLFLYKGQRHGYYDYPFFLVHSKL